MTINLWPWYSIVLLCPPSPLRGGGISRVGGTALSWVIETVFIHNRSQTLDAELSLQQRVEVHYPWRWSCIRLAVQWPAVRLHVQQCSLAPPETAGFPLNSIEVSSHQFGLGLWSVPHSLRLNTGSECTFWHSVLWEFKLEELSLNGASWGTAISTVPPRSPLAEAVIILIT